MTRWIFVMVVVLLAGAAEASGKRHLQGQAGAPGAGRWREECASCHVLYPPGMLPAASWKAIMGGLSRHFGTDASVDVPVAREIEQFLVANAGMRPMQSHEGTPVIRITQSPWFLRKHDGIPASVWARPAVKSPGNCTACHTGADADQFSDDGVRIPR